ncbi:unnamed protein product [Rangifer tarandus platyrhynchus]|uniref:Uncharacterized protein n=1 Tax=Rangifer tarandus platyrhynchus TaxID=3082113 RepID=A0AC59YQB2_RANTA
MDRVKGRRRGNGEARDEEWSARSPTLCGRALNGWRSVAPGSRGSQPQVRGALLRRSGRAGQTCTLLPPHRLATLPATPLAVAVLLKPPRGKGGTAATRES